MCIYRLFPIAVPMLFASVLSFADELPIPPDAWVDTTNLKPEYYESISNEYPNIGGVMHMALSFGDSTFYPTNGVLAYDREDGYLPVSVSGTVDVYNAGTYWLDYSATDSVGQTVEFRRKIIVLPSNVVARISTTGRFGAQDIRSLPKSYRDSLATNVSFIRYFVRAAPTNALQQFKEIRRAWSDGASGATNVAPPTAEEWAAVEEQTFYRELYVCRQPRVDRWFRITVSVGSNTLERTYGLKGDPGELFVSPENGETYIRLKWPVDDPMTVAEQHKYFSQGINYAYNWPIALQKRMGSFADQISAGNMQSISNQLEKDVLHGRPIFSRFYFSGSSHANTKDEWWSDTTTHWVSDFNIQKNRSFLRSYQVPVTELTSAALPSLPQTDYLSHIEELYYRLRGIDSKRIIALTPTGIGAYPIFNQLVYTNQDGLARTNGFPDKTSPYFKSEFHGFNMDSKFEGFESMPFFGVYSKVKLKHVHNHIAPVFYYGETRRWLRKAKQYGDKIEACVQEQFLIIVRDDDGSFGFYTLPYVALRHGYVGSHFLNNLPYFTDDWDGDGLPNAFEQQIGSNPFTADTDGDGIFDSDEYEWGLDIDRNDADEDLDGDGMSNLYEALYSKKLGWKITTQDIRVPLLDAAGNGIVGSDGNPVCASPRADRAEGRLLPQGEHFELPRTGGLFIGKPGLLKNDAVLRGDSNNVEIITIDAPTNGTLSIATNGAFVYRAPNGLSGDCFSYALADGNETSAPVRVVLDPYHPLHLEARWTFDAAGGTNVVDVTGNGHDGIMEGGARVADGISGYAYRCATGDTIRITLDSAPAHWAFAAWVKSSDGSAGRSGSILAGPSSRNRLILHHWRHGRTGYGHPGWRVGKEFDYTLPAGQWTHLIWAASTTNRVDLYVNGEFKGSIGIADGSVPCPTEYIADKFSGELDDLRLYAGILTPDRARRIYEAGEKKTYADWRIEHWGNPPPDGTEPEADRDGDGLPNLTEFALGLDPDAAVQLTDLLPRIDVTNGIRLHFRCQSGIAAQTCYQYSETLTNWTDLVRGIDFRESTASNSPADERVEFLLLGVPTNRPVGFLRVQFEEEL
jgi:hypothetical protein